MFQKIETASPGLTALPARDTLGLFRRVYDESLDAALLIGPAGALHAVNPKACALFGASEDELRASSADRTQAPLVDAEDSRSLRLFAERLATGRASGGLRFRRLDGRLFEAEVALFLFFDSGGDTSSVLTVRDLSTREIAGGLVLESEERLRLALRGGNLGLWDWDVASGTLVVDERWCSMLGLDPSGPAPTLDTWHTLVHPEDRPRLQRLVDEVILPPTGVDFEVEVRARHADGHWIWVLDSAAVTRRDTAGGPLRVTGTHQDITQRKLSEAALRTSAELLEYSQAAAKVGGWELTLATGHLYWTAETYRIHETTPAEYNPTLAAGISFYVPEARRTITAALQAAMEHGEGYDLELEARTSNGHLITVRTTCAVSLQDGKPFKLTGIFQDITAINQVLKAQIAANAQLRLLEKAVANLNDIVLITEAEPFGEPGHRIVFVNDAFVRRTGYSREEVIGKTPRILQGPKTQAAELARIGTALRKWEPVRAELINYTKSGGEYWLELDIVPVANDTGRFTHWVAVERDITERKATEMALLATNQELARSNAELAQFASVASHDLQEPLRAVSSCVQLLQKRYAGQLDARADEFIAHAVGGSLRMQTLIDDLLLVSRVNATPRVHNVIDSAAALAVACANLAGAIAQSSAQITHGALPSVQADPGQLAQLLQNLIGNAIKFRGKQAAVVHVGARQEGAEWVFWVADQGIGIEPPYFSRIFELFKRLHSRDEYAGTGIGLAICKKIVERHGGRIWVESQPALAPGATFYFTLLAPESPTPFAGSGP